MVRALMRHGWRAVLIGIGLASSGAHAQTVSLAEGSLRGATQDRVTSFKGIPFAAPHRVQSVATAPAGAALER